jgi:hypothetical protein
LGAAASLAKRREKLCSNLPPARGLRNNGCMISSYCIEKIQFKMTGELGFRRKTTTNKLSNLRKSRLVSTWFLVEPCGLELLVNLLLSKLFKGGYPSFRLRKVQDFFDIYLA